MRHREVVKQSFISVLADQVNMTHPADSPDWVEVTDEPSQTRKAIEVGEPVGVMSPVKGNGNRRVFEDDFDIECQIVIRDYGLTASEARMLAADLMQTVIDIVSVVERVKPVHQDAFDPDNTGQLISIGLGDMAGPTSVPDPDGQGSIAFFDFDVPCVYRTSSGAKP